MILIPVACASIALRFERLRPIFQNPIISLFESIRPENKVRLLTRGISMVRRLLFVITAIFIENHGEFQSMVYTFMSLLSIMFVAYHKPYDSRRINMIELFNEYTILVAGYHLFIFTDFVEDEQQKWNAGWSIIALIVVNLIVNLAVTTYDTLVQIANYLAKNCSKKKHKKLR